MIYNGKYTIENTVTHEHRTFSIKTQKDNAQFAPGQRILALLNGPDNDSDYQGFGFIHDTGNYSIWKSKRGINKPSHFEIYADMLMTLVLGSASRYGKEYNNYKVHLEAKCLRCNRTLTTPESITRGIGPECIQAI